MRHPPRPARASCRRAATAALLLCTMLGDARADPARDREVADALFWEGRAAADAGDFATACEKFAQSLRLDAAAGTLFNLAHCEERVGRFASALGHYREAARGMK